MASSAQTASRLLDDGLDWEVPFIYGTAWKKARTEELVQMAVAKGFRKFDTAAQPKHYQEPLVGAALREAYKDGNLKREDIYLQTKYTTPAGQDLSNMPYDASSPLETQIHTSVASSLQNLRHEPDSEENSYLDCLLLHSPLPTLDQTLQAWQLLESYVPHKIRSLGISNTNLQVLEAIYQNSTIKPSVVQNRFYPQTRYDASLRSFCDKNEIVYQSFWTLTGNPNLLKSDVVAKLADSAGVSRPVALYSLVIDRGITVLNGTTSVEHMGEDLRGVNLVREWALSHRQDWLRISEVFKIKVDGAHL